MWLHKNKIRNEMSGNPQKRDTIDTNIKPRLTKKSIVRLTRKSTDD